MILGNILTPTFKTTKLGGKQYECQEVKIQSNLHYTRCITPKHVTSGGTHLRGLMPGQHSSDETWWRAVGNTVYD